MLDATPLPPATRAEGLRRIAAFRPRMGRAYAAGRNHDHGPADRSNVSVLSPWTRRRLVLEAELIEAALSAHPFARAEKFVQEVAWRAYFKGWLEHRPAVWEDYAASRAPLRAATDPEALAAAETGRTGIAPFDAWAAELVATGYLHNHARMWFASIWTFTLGLPWQLGADFFLRHLLDGDPASNTCSWRWVAGLHTPGKTYAARPANIGKYTANRFGPVAGLAPDPAPVPGSNPPAGSLRTPRAPDPALPSVRLLTEEDLHPESLARVPVRATATVRLTRRRSERPVAPAVEAFDRAALADAAERAGGATALDHPGPEAVADWAAAHGAAQVVTAYLPAGWTRDWAEALAPALAARGIVLAEERRAYDATLWPHCRGGFFGLRKRLPSLLRELGLGG